MSENSVPSRTTTVITLCVVAIALAAVFLVGLTIANDDDNGTDAAPAATRSTTETYGVVTTGSANVVAKPDRLTFSATVTNRRSTTAEAMAATNSSVRALTGAAKDAGVAAADIETASLSIRPTYSYTSSGTHLTGYASTQRIRVLVRTLSNAGKVIGSVTTAGGNAVRIGGVTLSIGNKDALIAQARTAAVAKSKAAAQALAEAAGQDVGRLEYVEEVSPQQVYPDYAYKGLNGIADAAGTVPRSVPISPGKQTVSVTVKVRWSLK